MKVIDVHAHVGNSAALYVGGSIDAVDARMKANGITHSVVSPIPGFEDPEGEASVRKMNEQCATIQKEHCDRFPRALGVAEPRHGAVAAAREGAYALGELGLGGLMFHNDFAGVEMHSSVMFSIMDEVMRFEKRARLVLLHTAQHSMLEPPFALWVLAEKYPDITFICGHPMMSLIQLDNIVAIVKHCPNIYLDTCCTWTHNHMIETAIEKLGGSDHLMFGSDNPYYSEKTCIDKMLLEHANISLEDREKIYFKNYERVFGKVAETNG